MFVDSVASPVIKVFPFQCSDPIDEPDWYQGDGWYRRYEDGTTEWAGFTERQAYGFE